MKKLLHAITACITLSLSQFAFGLGKTYQVEVLIFSHLTPQNAQSEQWPTVSNTPPEIPLGATEIELSADHDANIINGNLTLIQPSQFNIKESPFKKNNAQHVLCHFGWIQDFSQTPSIELALDKTPSDQAPTSIQGLIHIDLKTYFNIRFNLLLSQSLSDFSHLTSDRHLKNIINDRAYFSFNQTRRMRSKELNYLDHPLYGILIYIEPIVPVDKDKD